MKFSCYRVLLKKRFYHNKKFCSTVFLSIIVLYVFYFSNTQKRLDINDIKIEIEQSLRESVSREKGTGCVTPDIPVFSDEVSKFLPNLPNITCEGIDWVDCHLSTCFVTEKIKKILYNIECTFRDIIFVSDFNYELSAPVTVYSNDKYELKDSDHVKVSCTGNRRGVITSNTWVGYKAGFRSVKKTPPPEDSFDVLILGFDSASHNGFRRHMPKVYTYLTEELNATVLNRYNIVGDGTPAALFPLLTGKTEWELPDARKITDTTIDNTYFIFDSLNKAGYRTAFFEDMPSIGTFQYRLNGFREQPADHYIRLLLEASFKMNWLDSELYKSPRCIGAVPEYLMLLNITAQFFELEGSHFCFTFIVQLTHDEFNLKMAEDDMMTFLRNFRDKGRLNNTMLIVMGDHGVRFSSEFRSTYQGKLEERLPFMAVALPERLKKTRPEVVSALKGNANVLTTPFDVYETIVEVVGMKKLSNGYTVPGSDLKRGLSLLKPIPASRSCGEAGVETHWCACVHWVNISRADPLFERAARALAERINNITAEKRTECAERQLVSIQWVMKKEVNDKVLQFQGNYDLDGFLGRFSKSLARATIEHYQAQIVMSPGKAIFEGSLRYNVKTDSFITTDRDISRITVYDDEPDCISKTHPHLNNFCYCNVILRMLEPMNII